MPCFKTRTLKCPWSNFLLFQLIQKLKKKIKINKAFQFKMLTNTPIYQKFNFTNEKFWTCRKMLHVLLENFILLTNIKILSKFLRHALLKTLKAIRQQGIMKKLLGFSHSFKSTLPYNKFFFFINLLAEVLLEDAATQTFLLFPDFWNEAKNSNGNLCPTRSSATSICLATIFKQ